jgi:putative membrane protein
VNDSAPVLSELLRQWSFDVVWLGAIGLAAVVYLRAALNPAAHRGHRPHQPWRSVSFAIGLVCLGIAVISPLEYYGNQFLWVDFTGFLVITMIVPPLILLGSPLTLAFRAGSPTARRRLRAIYRGPVAKLVTFPASSWLIFAAVTYLWQFTPLTDTAAHHAAVRDFQQFSLLAVGLLFWNPALCADPVRWRIPLPLRALYVFVEMTHKGLFGGMFLSMNHPMHRYFATHAPPWGPGPMTDQRMSILILWIGGNLIFLVALVGLVIRWVQYEARSTARTDARLAKARAAETSRRTALERVFQKPV